jgi:hypothetical protein
MRRRAAGHAGLSLAWGAWEQPSGMTGHLTSSDVARLRRLGIEALESDRGMRLFDAGLSMSQAVLVPVGIDRVALNARLRTSGTVPAMLRHLVRGVRRTAKGAPADTGACTRLATLDRAGRLAALVELVRTEAAAELGYRSVEAIGAERAFREPEERGFCGCPRAMRVCT